MGSHPVEYETSGLKSTEGTNVGGPIKIEAKSLLRNSGQRVFGGNGNMQQKGASGEYKTTN